MVAVPGLFPPAPSCSAGWLYLLLLVVSLPLWSVCIYILASDLEVLEGRICGPFVLFLPVSFQSAPHPNPELKHA